VKDFTFDSPTASLPRDVRPEPFGGDVTDVAAAALLDHEAGVQKSALAGETSASAP
jgi:hypothetical protein